MPATSHSYILLRRSATSVGQGSPTCSNRHQGSLGRRDGRLVPHVSLHSCCDRVGLYCVCVCRGSFVGRRLGEHVLHLGPYLCCLRCSCMYVMCLCLRVYVMCPWLTRFIFGTPTWRTCAPREFTLLLYSLFMCMHVMCLCLPWFIFGTSRGDMCPT
jgi:hypothetical protein